MNKYQSFKSSNVEWIGDIPFHWEIKPLYSESYLTKEKNPFEDLPILSLSYGKIKIRNIDSNIGLLPESFDSYQRIRKGNVVLRLTDLQNDKTSLRVGYSELEGLITPVYVSLGCKNSFNNRYLFYQLYDSDIKKVLYTLGGGLRQTLRFEELKRYPLVVPPISEQLQIVQFLDSKTELIDKLISTKERKITLLKEQRTSFINQIVTKGLNPKVKMKNTGIEWIGEIPEHWSLGKLNYLCKRIGDGLHSTPIYTDNSEYYFINGNTIKENKIVIFENTKTIEYEEYKKHFIELDNNNTLLMSINGTIGSIGYYNDEKVILGKSVSYINVIPSSINLDYLFYLLGSSSIQNYFTFELTGTTIYNLSLNTIRKTPICLPDKTEQVQIVEFLDSKTKEIDDMVQLEQKKIDLLKEYRQSLISEVVTGKIKVTTDE